MCSLVGYEDLEAAYDLRQRDRLVLFPFLHSFLAVNEDDKVLVRTLVVHLGLGCVSTRHVGGVL